MKKNKRLTPRNITIGSEKIQAVEYKPNPDKHYYDNLTLKDIEDALYELSCKQMGIEAAREFNMWCLYEGQYVPYEQTPMFHESLKEYLAKHDMAEEIHKAIDIAYKEIQHTQPPPLPIKPIPLIVKPEC
jgi:hypothetical protein